MTQVSTKLFRLDLGYFRKNFLNQETWGEKHLLYENSTIEVHFQQHSIVTSEQQLRFEVTVKIIDKTYFVENFGMPNDSRTLSATSSFFVPIDNKEFTDEVFVRKVYGAFKEAFSGYWGCFYSYKSTTISNKLKEQREKISGTLNEQAKVIYDNEQAPMIKKFISETRFCSEYKRDNEIIANISKVENGLESNVIKYVCEKDDKLFCDFLGLGYQPSSDIETYKKYLELAGKILK